MISGDIQRRKISRKHPPPKRIETVGQIQKKKIVLFTDGKSLWSKCSEYKLAWHKSVMFDMLKAQLIQKITEFTFTFIFVKTELQAPEM